MKKLSELHEDTFLYNENSGRVLTAGILIDEIEAGQSFEGVHHTVRINRYKGADEIIFLEEVEIDVINQ
ncbi:hypothetical protein EVJ32_04995 [Exiguobacterium sp. SH5S4]|uniref:hypothetical protein n=1 Tax=Exiguobacterium sp. SH5S4 TaxID=2510961 RepID=UPI00103E7AED|nr:hypothetical protein [Exiguobacterium sp. SH5S4]TCI26734.1 hypothetical protein EVJ32_04995 [Exiguobacterium sp. SH5S4]